MTRFEDGPRRLARRRFLIGSAAFGLVAACHRKAASPDALRAAIVGKGESNTELLFKAAGLVPDFPIHYARFESGHLIVEAMNSGAIDIGGMSEIPPVFAAASTAQSFREVAIYHGDVNNQVILVPRRSTLQTLADLKPAPGQRKLRVGYVRATTTQYFLIRMLQSVGLGWDDIEPVAMTVSDGAEAFAQGSLDAWAIYGFPIQRAMATQGARILTTALGFLSGNYIVAAANDALADPRRSDWVGRYLTLHRKAYAWARANERAFAGIVARDIGVPTAYVEDQFRRRSAPTELRPVTAAAIASQQSVADVFADARLIPHRVDVRPLWDARFNALITAGA